MAWTTWTALRNSNQKQCLPRLGSWECFLGLFLVGGVCLEVIKHYHMANIEIKMSILFGYYLKDSPLPVQDVMCFSFFSFLINNYFLVLDYIIL